MASVTINAATQQVKITALSGAVPVGARIPTGGTSGQTLTKASGDNYDTEWSTPSGSGDMVAATYDPTAVAGDAFDMANMVEATTEKIFTATERTKLSGIEAGATADQTGAQIKAAYEAEANAYTDTLNTKLAGIEASADVTDEANVVASLDGATLTAVTVAGTDKVVVQDASDSDNIKTVTAQSIADLGGGGGSPEGTAVLSTGETGGTKFLREDGDGTSSWQTISGGGDALVANPLSQFAATTSAQLAGVLSDETGSGAAVFGTSPTLTTPTISGDLTTNGLIDGRDVDADGTKLDGVETAADVTDETNVVASLNGATLTAVTVAGADKVVIQDASDTDNIKTVTAQSIADMAAGGGTVDTSGTPVANDFARFTDVDTIEGRSYAEVKADLDLEIGTDVQAYDASLDSLAGLSLAAGDVIYATAADTLARLAKGTASQVLTMNSGATAPEWAAASGGGGSVTAIETATDISGVSYDLEDLLTTYRKIHIRMYDMVSPDANAKLYAKFSDDGGVTFETTGYIGNSTTEARLYTGGSWDASDSEDFGLTIERLSGTIIRWRALFSVNSAGAVSAEEFGYFDSGSAVDAMQIYSPQGSLGASSRLTAWGFS